MNLAIIQARMTSTRLPGKIMMKILNRPVIELLLERLGRAKRIDKIMVATSLQPSNDVLCQFLDNNNVQVFRGDENDVLDRFYQAANIFKPKAVVRITADCPLLDWNIVDQAVDLFYKDNADYVSNVNPPTYPDGLDVEVIRFKALCKAWEKASLVSEREHVTPYIRNKKEFAQSNLSYRTDLSSRRWALDNSEDFEVISKIFQDLYPKNSQFVMEDVLNLEKQQPEIFRANKHLIRNEGYLKSLQEDRTIIKVRP